MAVAQYLADTSAWARLSKPAVRAEFAPLIRRGLVATCGPVDLEMSYGARNTADHDRLRAERAWLERLVVLDECWERAIEVHAKLAEKGLHRSVPMPHLLIAATAERHGVTVLHYDADFDLIAEVTGQLTRWVAPRGTAD